MPVELGEIPDRCRGEADKDTMQDARSHLLYLGQPKDEKPGQKRRKEGNTWAGRKDEEEAGTRHDARRKKRNISYLG